MPMHIWLWREGPGWSAHIDECQGPLHVSDHC